MKKGKLQPLGKWLLDHPIVGLLSIPFLRLVPPHWLAAADELGDSSRLIIATDERHQGEDA